MASAENVLFVAKMLMHSCTALYLHMFECLLVIVYIHVVKYLNFICFCNLVKN